MDDPSYRKLVKDPLPSQGGVCACASSSQLARKVFWNRLGKLGITTHPSPDWQPLRFQVRDETTQE